MNIKLVKNYNQIRPDRATLFCFPFAGGGASAYNSWVQKNERQSNRLSDSTSRKGREDYGEAI